jgi:hypothetical protein
MNFYRMGALIILLAGMVGAPSAFSQYGPGGPKLRGTITSADGKPLEGVTVSIRGAGKTFVTSVFTNLQGVYVFPAVEKGIKYSLWAQAQGFQTARLNVDAGTGEGQQIAGLQLQPLANFEKQLTGVEWMNSFPERTPAESREKRIYAANCSGCHANQFTLQNRFDADGWRKIVTVMSLSSNGTPIRPNAPGTPTINAYMDEIVGFLTKGSRTEPGKLRAQASAPAHGRSRTGRHNGVRSAAPGSPARGLCPQRQRLDGRDPIALARSRGA